MTIIYNVNTKKLNTIILEEVATPRVLALSHVVQLDSGRNLLSSWV
jgi:hypothetical protein